MIHIHILLQHVLEKGVLNWCPFLQDLESVEDMGRNIIDQLRLEGKWYCCKIDSMYYNVTRGKLSHPDDMDPRDKNLNKGKCKRTRAKIK